MKPINAALLAPLLLSGLSASAAPNLYPDPSFEVSGITGAVRTGERSGHLKVDAKEHWNSIGTQVTVEPFARYRITEWVRGRVGTGGFFAPYVYGWDSFEWAFAGGRPIQTLNDWTQTEYTLVTPETSIYVAPLAYIDAAHCEVWVDDILVEKTAEPAAVMAEVLAKPSPDDNEQRLMVRWLVLRGDLAGAEKLMLGSQGLTRADAATVIAKAIPDAARRRPYVVQMVAYGGPTYNDGMKRFGEITRDLAPQERFGIAVEAIRLNPGDERAGRAVRAIIAANAPTDSLATVAESLTQCRDQLASLQEAVAAVPAASPAAKELQSAVSAVTQQMGSVQARQASLGSCTIRVARQAIAPADYAIVVPDQATAPERYAARDLRYHLELITGQVFPLRSESENGHGAGFFVGRTRKAADAGVKCNGLGLEGIHLKTVGRSLVLAGNQRGCLYAVYTFLEDSLGCRWFTPDCSTWPKEGALTVPKLSRRFIPPLEFRAGDYPVAKSGEFSVRCRLNGNNHQMSAEQGGRKGVHSLAHTFAALCPPEKYFAQHPEYFSLVGGKRQSGYAQLCLTNPEVLKIVCAGVRQWIRDLPDMKVFSVSQNDTDMHCECEACTRVADEEGSQMGPVLRFVNAVADDIRADHPDVAIETLAYQYTRKPPKVTKPRPNVIICLCSIECCFIHPLGSDEFNRTFADDIRGWNRICQRLWIWDYVINYAHSICPFPNLDVLKPNIRFFLDNGVKGIYEESCYYTPGSELQELRNYIIAKTLWDPEYDTDKAVGEFCAAYYGSAAGPVRAYLGRIHQSVQAAAKLHVQIYTHPSQYVSPEVVAQASGLFDQAEAAVAGDPVLLHRVQVARLPVQYAQIVLGTSGAFIEKDGALVQQEGQDVGAVAERFAKVARAEGVTHLREGPPNLDAWLDSLPRAATRTLALEQLRNAMLRVDVLPGLGGRLFRLVHLPTQRQLLRVGGTEQALSPLDGGYEEYTQGTYRSAGCSEPYAVTAKTDRSVTVAATLRSGLRVTRTFGLDPQKALLSITSTLTNDSQQPLTASLRSHPEFAVTTTERCQVVVAGPGGKQSTILLANPKDPSAERDQWLRDTDTPEGQWTLVDEGAGLAVVNRFERGDVALALLNRSGRQARVNLELFGKEALLQPGQSLTLRQSFEVTTP
jgi:hypothetical protein